MSRGCAYRGPTEAVAWGDRHRDAVRFCNAPEAGRRGRDQVLLWKRVSESGTEPFDQPRAFVTQFRLTDAAGERLLVSSSDRAVIGKDEGCDLTLADRTVSRFHCEI